MTEQADLSGREREILALVARGASNKEIARDLHISTNTVKVHLRNIFAKVGANSRTEAAMYAVNAGLVDVKVNGSAGPQEELIPPRNRFLWVGLGIVVLLLVGGVIGVFTVRGTLENNQSATSQSLLPDEQRWQSKAPMREARQGLALVEYGGKIYAIAGESEKGITGTVEEYEPSLDRWSNLGTKPTPVTDVSAAVIGGRIYVPGGQSSSGEISDILEIYSPLDDTWERGANLPIKLSGYAMAANEGNLYLFGGWDGEAYRDTVLQYNPEQDAWREMTPMSTKRGYAGAAVAGGKIYVVGGYDGNEILSLTEIYIPEMEGTEGNPWSVGTSLPSGRYHMGIAGLGNLVHIVGGITASESEQTALVYSSQDGVWQEFSSPNKEPLTGLGLVPFDTQLFMMGGQLGDKPTGNNSAYQAIYTFVIPIIR
ncbi:MAG: hypothetical protein JSV42_15880 [Chloroflexota bacterium]|nr:MAG: hypothetical protein JSV42_15880 [Chloroflexota bacterium]